MSEPLRPGRERGPGPFPAALPLVPTTRSSRFKGPWVSAQRAVSAPSRRSTARLVCRPVTSRNRDAAISRGSMVKAVFSPTPVGQAPENVRGDDDQQPAEHRGTAVDPVLAPGGRGEPERDRERVEVGDPQPAQQQAEDGDHWHVREPEQQEATRSNAERAVQQRDGAAGASGGDCPDDRPARMPR